jgi:hypothetical protein
MMSTKPWWNDTAMGKTKVLRGEPVPAPCSPQISLATDLELKPSLCGETPTNNCLSQGMALKTDKNKV